MKKIIRTSTISSSLNRFLKGQLKELSSYYEVVAVSSPGKDLTELGLRENVRTVAIPIERHIFIIKDLVSLIRMIHLLYKEKPDLVHSMTPKAGLITMVAAWITRVPVRIHTFTGLIFPSKKGLMQKLLIMMDKLTCYCATYVNPEGFGVMNDLKNFKVTKKQMHVIANGNVRGIDANYYNKTDELTNIGYNELGDELKQTFNYCFVGRLVKDKGINELVEAFKKINLSNKKTRLILIGNFENELDPLNVSTHNEIETNDSILYLGRKDDIRPYLAISDVFVFPSYREGMPNVILEAGAMGLPSIVTNINGSNEIIINNKNGIVVPVKNIDKLYYSMQSVLLDRSFLANMASNSRELVLKRFSQNLILDELLKVYSSLLK